jgi:DnaK suppressor protein
MTNPARRNAELRLMLSERRRNIVDEVQRRIRDERTDRSKDVHDDVEVSDAGSRGDITFALLEMRAETLSRVEEALVRLDAGEYGSCAACDGEISKRRLRAMPFAVRCQACQEKLERESGHVRELARRRGSYSLYPDAVGS